jgi:acyl carrier protein
MNSTAVRREIKELIVRELKLEGRDATSIDDGAPLFGEGLGLDSLDALQLVMALEETYGVKVPEGDEARLILASVATIAAFIERSRTGP